MDELDQIIDKAIADGLSDDDIQFIIGEWRAAQPSTPPPAAATAGMLPQSTMEDPRTAGIGSPNVRRVFDQANQQAAASRQDVMEHPGRFAAEMAIPGVVAGAMKYARPVLGATVRALEDPLVGATGGAAIGYNRGGLLGAAEGAAYGAVGAGVVGRLSSLGQRLGSLGAKSTPAPPPVPPGPQASVNPRGVGPSTTTSNVPAGPMPSAPVPLVASGPKPAPAPTAPPRTGTAMTGSMPSAPTPFMMSVPAPKPAPAAAPAPKPAPAPAVVAEGPSLPAASKSKGATKMSANDMKVYEASIKGGMSSEDAVAEMLKQRAARAATNYNTAKEAAASRKGTQ